MGMHGLMEGLALVLDWQSMLVITCGLFLGFTAGLLPGFSSSSAAALVLSFSLALNTEDALILMVSLYAGDLFSGAVPAITMGIPGTPGAAVTALDGFPMTQRGEAGLAIGVARMASVVGGVLGSLVVIFAIAPLSHLALLFGTREMFVVAILGLFIIGTVVGDRPLRGLLSGGLGMVFAIVGLNPVTSQPRLTFGALGLYDGLPIIAVIVGTFAVSQIMQLANSSQATITDHALIDNQKSEFRQVLHGIRFTLSRPVLLLRSTLLGLVIGALPGTGTAVAGFASYDMAKRYSKDPDSFGKGNPDGIIAAEAADHGVTAGVLIPTFTLGIPGSGTAAVMLAALYLHGVTPGPRVMVTNRPEVYAVLVGLLVASILILPLGVLLGTAMIRVTRLKKAYLVPPVLMLSFIGAFALSDSYFDVGILIFFGIVGCIFRYCNYPVVPLVLGLILGPLAETNFTRALQLGQNRLGYFFGSPTTIVLWAGVAALIVAGIWRGLSRKRQQAHG
jgi:putative tricarboxylic transport membrane protein